MFLPILRSFAKKDHKTFFLKVNSLLKNAGSDQEFLGVLSALFEQVKNMLLVKELSKDHSPAQIDEMLDFKGGRSKFLALDARGFEKEELERLLEKILDLEYNIKNGRTVLAPALWQAIKTK